MQSTHTLPHARTRARRGAPPSGALHPGELALDRYRLLERLGAGGFGVVWRARDELLDREVALKRVPVSGPEESQRAGREALAAARLSHPAIVVLHEAHAAPEAFYLVSELVHGPTLAQLIAARALSDADARQIGLALADALTHAHARGVIHRDVKPQNVLVPERGDRRAGEAVAKLTDFGGARMSGDDVHTRTGDVLGTLAYMAPEQCEGRQAGEEADLYSLALVLYEALCGSNPVRGASAAATARRIGAPIESLQRRRPDLDPQLVGAIDRALAPAPEQRGTLAELRLALARRSDGLAAEASATLASVDVPWPTAVRRAGAHPADALLAPMQAPPSWSEPPTGAPRLRHRSAMAGPGRGPLRSALRRRTAAAPEPPRTAAPHPAALPAPAAEPPLPGHRAPSLPRALWVGGALALAVWQALSGRPGEGLLVLAAFAPLVLLPRRSGPWPLAAVLAPVLGLARLAGAFPALAGQAAGWRARATLGALGYWWLTLSEPLLSRKLWLGPPAAIPPRTQWEASLGSAATHVIAPTLTVGVLLGAALWGAGAVCLPWLVRGRRATLDVVAATMWSAALAAAAPLLDAGLHSGAHASPHGAVLGAVFGGVLAVAACAMRAPV